MSLNLLSGFVLAVDKDGGDGGGSGGGGDLPSSLQYEKGKSNAHIQSIESEKWKQTNQNIGYLCDDGGNDNDDDGHQFEKEFFFSSNFIAV